jgi:hypothetical protein
MLTSHGLNHPTSVSLNLDPSIYTAYQPRSIDGAGLILDTFDVQDPSNIVPSSTCTPSSEKMISLGDQTGLGVVFGFNVSPEAGDVILVVLPSNCQRPDGTFTAPDRVSVSLGFSNSLDTHWIHIGVVSAPLGAIRVPNYPFWPFP